MFYILPGAFFALSELRYFSRHFLARIPVRGIKLTSDNIPRDSPRAEAFPALHPVQDMAPWFCSTAHAGDAISKHQ